MLTFEGHGEPPYAVVEARGCAVVDMIIRRTWRAAIQGRVVRANGEPAPAGLDLALILLQNEEGKERSYSLFNRPATTNERGEYAFLEVAPGRYRIVMNEYRFPDAKAPYPTIYWPGSRTEAGALAIQVSDAPLEQRFDFSLPPEPKSRRVVGFVLGPDGTPAQGAVVYIGALPDNDIVGDNANRPRTDEHGQFSFIAFDGFEYRLQAIQTGAGTLHSGYVLFSLRDGSQPITLLLDRPGRFDGDPVERKWDKQD